MARDEDKSDALRAYIRDLTAKCKLESWNSFTEAIDVPADLYPALQTGRGGLTEIARARELSAVECRALYKLIGTLIDTNTALRTHAADVANLVDRWGQAFTMLRSVGAAIEDFANFREPPAKETE